jgi:hypothetical protein
MGVVPSQLPPTPVICMVDVDTVTGKNICIFEKDSVLNPGLSHYNFYRESISAGQYQLLGSKSASLPSKWTDQSANPLQHAWRYRVSAVDTCGNESPISAFHKTIHLAANVGVNGNVNLIWDDYEGISYSTFYIYRYTQATGWDSLDAVSGNVHSYTDLNPPVPLVNVNYFVGVDNPAGCKVSVKDPPQPMTSNLNLSKSNINKINASGILPYNDLAASVQVYPNPTSRRITLVNEKLKVGKIELYNLFGGLVLQQAIISKTEELDLDVPGGVYFLKLIGEQGAVTKKIVVQR